MTACSFKVDILITIRTFFSCFIFFLFSKSAKCFNSSNKEEKSNGDNEKVDNCLKEFANVFGYSTIGLGFGDCMIIHIGGISMFKYNKPE